MKKWFLKIKDKVDGIKNLSSGGGGDNPSSSKIPSLTLEEFIEFSNIHCTNPEETYLAYVYCFPEYIKLKDSVYPSCPNCKKKLQKEMGSNQLRCDREGVFIDKPVPCYMMSVKLTDFSHSLFVTAFNAAE